MAAQRFRSARSAVSLDVVSSSTPQSDSDSLWPGVESTESGEDNGVVAVAMQTAAADRGHAAGEGAGEMGGAGRDIPLQRTLDLVSTSPCLYAVTLLVVVVTHDAYDSPLQFIDDLNDGPINLLLLPLVPLWAIHWLPYFFVLLDRWEVWGMHTAAQLKSPGKPPPSAFRAVFRDGRVELLLPELRAGVANTYRLSVDMVETAFGWAFFSNDSANKGADQRGLGPAAAAAVALVAAVHTVAVWTTTVTVLVWPVLIFTPIFRVSHTATMVLAWGRGKQLPKFGLWDLAAALYFTKFFVALAKVVSSAFMTGECPVESLARRVGVDGVELPSPWRYNTIYALRFISLQTIAIWRPRAPWTPTRDFLAEHLAKFAPIPFGRPALIIMGVASTVGILVAHSQCDALCTPKVGRSCGWRSCSEARMVGLQAANAVALVMLFCEFMFPYVVRQTAAKGQLYALQWFTALFGPDVGPATAPGGLEAAAAAGEYAAAKQLVAAGADLDRRNSGAIAAATANRDVKMVDYLLGVGASPVACGYGITLSPSEWSIVRMMLICTDDLRADPPCDEVYHRVLFGLSSSAQVDLFVDARRGWSVRNHPKLPAFARRWVLTLFLCVERCRSDARRKAQLSHSSRRAVCCCGEAKLTDVPPIPVEMLLEMLQRIHPGEMRPQPKGGPVKIGPSRI